MSMAGWRAFGRLSEAENQSVNSGSIPHDGQGKPRQPE